MNNFAFIDGQNLHLGTREENWNIDNKKLRRYLLDKYKVSQSYYFLGYLIPQQEKLYQNLKDAGFILLFREHQETLKGNKKGNVDTDIVFEMMKNIIENPFGKILLVSGDGDYKKTVEYLIKKNKFKKILFPNKSKSSSLYKKLGSEYYDFLNSLSIRKKIEYKKKKAP